MAYRSILSLIDAELERLIAARDMLMHDPGVQAAAEAPVAPVEAAAPAPRRVAPARATPRRMKLRGERKQSMMRKRVPMQTALAAAIPAGPVAVSAAAVAARQKPVAGESAAKNVRKDEPQGDGGLDALLRDLKARGGIV